MESNLRRETQLPPLSSNCANQWSPLFNINLMCGEEERIVAEYGEKILPVFL